MRNDIVIRPESLGNEKSIWECYNEMATVDGQHPGGRVPRFCRHRTRFVCTDTLQGIYPLIRFQDGLSVASLSAFLVFLDPQLQANSTEVAGDVLINI